MKFDVINLSVKEEMKGGEPKGKNKAKTIAYKLIESLLKNDPEETRTVIRYIKTQKNDRYMSEKLADVQRIANQLLEDVPNVFKDLTGGNDWALLSGVPFSKVVKSEKFIQEDGYEETIKVQEVKFYLTKRSDLQNHSEIRLSVAKDSSNPGAVASRILRNILVDKKETKVTFVLSKENKTDMCEKLMSMFRIIGRMAKENGIQIHESLPVGRSNVKISVEGPYIRKAESKEGHTVFVQEYGFHIEK